MCGADDTQWAGNFLCLGKEKGVETNSGLDAFLL